MENAIHSPSGLHAGSAGPVVTSGNMWRSTRSENPKREGPGTSAGTAVGAGAARQASAAAVPAVAAVVAASATIASLVRERE
jgi:hypothetical protein